MKRIAGFLAVVVFSPLLIALIAAYAYWHDHQGGRYIGRSFPVLHA